MESTTVLEAARTLFNDGRYLACHELFEELWEGTQGADADCYKGLLQAAVAMHHWEEQNPEGALRLYRGHRRYLAPYLPAHLGLDLTRFLNEMQSFFRPLLEGGLEGDEAHGAAPRLERVGT